MKRSEQGEDLLGPLFAQDAAQSSAQGDAQDHAQGPAQGRGLAATAVVAAAAGADADAGSVAVGARKGGTASSRRRRAARPTLPSAMGAAGATSYAPSHASSHGSSHTVSQDLPSASDEDGPDDGPVEAVAVHRDSASAHANEGADGAGESSARPKWLTLARAGSERESGVDAHVDEGSASQRPHVFRVSELNRSVKQLLEGTYREVWVEGELSDVTRSPAGHVYFTLNDEREAGQIRSAMFRATSKRGGEVLKNGKRVRLAGTLSIYEARGSYQLIARHAEAVGEGDLAAKFEALRRKLFAEGLLAEERKRALPPYPFAIGLVTSEAGAALHDFVRVSEARGGMRIWVADCRVQGETAPASIVRALRKADAHPEVEVVVLTRGGGSAEDLWAFNDEAVARAIVACRNPVVSGVGHEVDVTIADLVADLRAATPSNAAEIVVPHRATTLQRIEHLVQRLDQGFDEMLALRRTRWTHLCRRMGDPRLAIGVRQEQLTSLRMRLVQAMHRRHTQTSARNQQLMRRLLEQDARAVLHRDRQRWQLQLQQLDRAGRRMLVDARSTMQALQWRLRDQQAQLLPERSARLGRVIAGLDAMSPLKVMSRGYALALRDDGRAVRAAGEMRVGERFSVRVHVGTLRAEVLAIDGVAETTDLPGSTRHEEARITSQVKPKGEGGT